MPIWLDTQMLFDRAEWSEFEEGDPIYFVDLRHKPNDRVARGPFRVVDPNTRRVENMQGVRFAMPDIQPLRLNPKMIGGSG